VHTQYSYYDSARKRTLCDGDASILHYILRQYNYECCTNITYKRVLYNHVTTSYRCSQYCAMCCITILGSFKSFSHTPRLLVQHTVFHHSECFKRMDRLWIALLAILHASFC